MVLKMISLQEINEDNWLTAARLSVDERQQRFLDKPLGIIARGYVYRKCNARVYAIAKDTEIIGITLVKDLDEDPACYDLQQFMIDSRFQKRGYGTEALKLILSEFGRERKYDCIEVCVDKENIPALHMYRNAGFTDTGYIDENAPECVNLRYRFG